MTTIGLTPFPDGPIPFPPLPFPPLPIEWPRRPPFEFEKPVWDHIRWGPARIRILVVTDGASYNESTGFGLGIALKDAFDPAHPEHPSYARFTFTRATHARQSPGSFQPDEGWDGIELTTERLAEFDELWLFGVRATAPYLTTAEVNAVHAFMDRGGGVLAMGDHEDLGLGMCGQIKRVRSMRKWWFVSPTPPSGMEVAPDNTDLTRNDTVHAPTPGADVNAGTQSDATPQIIYPNYRYALQWWRPGRLVKYPHPVLCGPRGTIVVMPDHQHEGDCILPAAAFAGEYPGGVPVEIIARGRNVVGRTKSGITITDPREFGLLGVWDGHQADDGRVLVDSTWHHWFNTNLVGLRAENGNEYKDILAFFRNVAVWLAPVNQQQAMRRAGTLVFMLTASMIELTMTLREFRPDRLYTLGVHARDVLGRVAPQCQSIVWFTVFIEKLLPRGLLKPEGTTREEIDLLRVATTETLVATMLGGAINALAVALNERGFRNLDAMAAEVDQHVERGAKEGLKVALKSLTRAHKGLAALLK